MDLRDLYEEVILDHNRTPRNYQKKPEAMNRTAHGYNPLCGDDIQVHLTVSDGLVTDVGFEGRGCAISTASASLMTEAILGKTETEVHDLFANVHAMLTSKETASGADVGKLSVLSGVRDYPMRIKCATLAWHTLEAALLTSGSTVSTE